MQSLGQQASSPRANCLDTCNPSKGKPAPWKQPDSKWWFHLAGRGQVWVPAFAQWTLLCFTLDADCLKVRTDSRIGPPHLSAENINHVYFSWSFSGSVIRVSWAEAGALAGVLNKRHQEWMYKSLLFLRGRCRFVLLSAWKRQDFRDRLLFSTFMGKMGASYVFAWLDSNKSDQVA